jgi:hypothetical protein
MEPHFGSFGAPGISSLVRPLRLGRGGRGAGAGGELSERRQSPPRPLISRALFDLRRGEAARRAQAWSPTLARVACRHYLFGLPLRLGRGWRGFDACCELSERRQSPLWLLTRARSLICGEARLLGSHEQERPIFGFFGVPGFISRVAPSSGKGMRGGFVPAVGHSSGSYLP